MKLHLIVSAISALFVVVGCSAGVEPTGEADPTPAEGAAVQSDESAELGQTESAAAFKTLNQWWAEGGQRYQSCFDHGWRGQSCCNKSRRIDAQRCFKQVTSDNRNGAMCLGTMCPK
jgi:hypothetical protein